MATLAQALSNILGVARAKDTSIQTHTIRVKDHQITQIETCEICGETGNLQSDGEFILCPNCRVKVVNL